MNRLEELKKKKEEIETRKRIIATKYELIGLAERLNGSYEINWSNRYQDKYFLYFNYISKKIDQDTTLIFKNIYCLYKI